MGTKSFYASMIGDTASAVDFITNILQASNEYSITSKSLDGTILLCNGGAQRLYGHEPSVLPNTGRVCFDSPLQREAKCTST